jgi:hypothetical protein
VVQPAARTAAQPRAASRARRRLLAPDVSAAVPDWADALITERVYRAVLDTVRRRTQLSI